MRLTAFKCPKLRSGDYSRIEDWLISMLPTLPEKGILAISGKIISLIEGNTSKEERNLLIRRESEKQFGKGDFILTRKLNRLLPNAGIDGSNVEIGWVLLPNNPQSSAVKIWSFLRQYWQLKKLGVIITDSNLIPLRRGTVGIGIGWCGFKALRDYRGKFDLFGKKMQVSVANLLDGLASAAVLLMGEGDEQQPIVLIEDAPVIFQSSPPSAKEERALVIPEQEDLFSQFSR